MSDTVEHIEARNIDEQPLAIGFSDLRGFSAFTAERGDREAYRIAQRFSDLVERHVSDAGGRVLKTYGDGVMTTFDNTHAALDCAADMQRSLSEYNEEHVDEPMSAGIGLSWGTVIATPDDVFGHSVNLAKRLADVAKGGQVVLSSDFCDRTDVERGFCLRDLGHMDVKGLGEHRIYELVWRDEVANLCLNDNSLNVVLTDDDKLVLEFAKTVKDKLELAQKKLQEEAQSEGGGVRASLSRQVAKRLSRRLPKWIDSWQARAGLGEEHQLRDIHASLSNGKLTIKFGTGRKLTLDGKDVDIDQARRFIEKLNSLKTAHSS